MASRFGLMLAAIAVALVLTELALRVRVQRTSHGLHSIHALQPGSPWIFGLRPGSRGTLEISGDVLYEINADGFRDRRYPRARPAGVLRIAVLGDSVAFGYGVPEPATFATRLETALGAGFEVLNFGVGGYNPYNEAALLEGVVLGYEPDLVLLQFCVNDLNDPTLAFDAATRLHLGVLPDAAFPRARRPSRSLLPAALWPLCARLELCLRAERALNAADLARETLTWLAPAEDLSDAEVRQWIARLYARMATAARGAGADFAVLGVPHHEQVTEGASPRLARDLGALGAEGGWPTLDLLPAFRRAAAESSEPLFLDLWHLNARGHAVTAAAVLTALRERGLLRRPGGDG